MKTLVTKRLILRSLKVTDLADMYAYAKKDTIGPRAGWAPHQSIEETSKIIKMMINENEVWAITIKPNDQMVGTIGLHARSFENAIANQKEIGFVLDDLYWGLGYMPEAVMRMIQYAFEDLELDKVLCGHKIDNLQSKRVIEKCGFTYTHTEERDDRSAAGQVKIMVYELSKARYKELLT